MQQVNTLVVSFVKRSTTEYICIVHSAGHWLAGTGRTGYLHVAPNNYPFYSDEEKYIPIMQSDGGQLSGKLQATPGSKHGSTRNFCMHTSMQLPT